MRKELLLAATLAVGAITACEAGTPIPVDPALSGHPALPRIRPAPEFALKDVDGVPVSLAGIGPKVRLVSFVYTSCSAACPLLTERMARLQQAVAEAGARGMSSWSPSPSIPCATTPPKCVPSAGASAPTRRTGSS